MIKSIDGTLHILVDGIYKNTKLKDNSYHREILKNDILPKIGGFTVHYFAKIYLNQKNHLKTYDEIENLVNRYILPRWGEYRITSIKKHHIKEWIFNELAMVMSFKTVRKYLTPLNGILEIAIEHEVIDKNPAENIKIPKHDKEDIEIFSSDEVELILKTAKGWFKNYLALSFYTGLRGGEVIALLKNDIDLDSGIINVSKSITKGKVTTPKTASSVRLMPIFTQLLPYIKNQLELTDSNYLFTNINNNHFNNSNHVRGDTKAGRWARLLNKANVEYKRIYATRHTFATQMLNSGKYKIMDIAKLLGHSSPQMIFRNYAKFIKSEHLQIDKDFDLYKKYKKD